MQEWLTAKFVYITNYLHKQPVFCKRDNIGVVKNILWTNFSKLLLCLQTFIPEVLCYLISLAPLTWILEWMLKFRVFPHKGRKWQGLYHFSFAFLEETKLSKHQANGEGIFVTVEPTAAGVQWILFLVFSISNLWNGRQSQISFTMFWSGWENGNSNKVDVQLDFTEEIEQYKL